MKIEIDDEVTDHIVKKQCEKWIEYYERELELVKLHINDKIGPKERTSVFWSKPKRDKKEIKRRLKAWRIALEDYNFMSKFY
jgi:hypothetical protein